MFKKKCSRCNRKIQRDFDFCPYCGVNLGKERDEKDYGFLGNNDFLNPVANPMQNLGAGLPLGFDKILSGLMKELEKEMSGNLDKKAFKSNSFSISISSSGNPQIQINQPNEEKLPKQEISEEKMQEYKKLPRKEAQATMKRLDNKIIYELDTPGVSSLKDVSISKLESGIEIKAFSKNKAYTKLIPLKSLLKYRLADDKLILEFKGK